MSMNIRYPILSSINNIRLKLNLIVTLSSSAIINILRFTTCMIRCRCNNRSSLSAFPNFENNINGNFVDI